MQILISIHIQSSTAHSKNRRAALLWNWKAKVWIQCWTRRLKSFLPVLPSCFMTPAVMCIFLVKASSFGLFLICNAEATKWPSIPCPLWKRSPYFRCCVVGIFFFVTCMSSYSISASLAVFTTWLCDRRTRSPIFSVSRVRSRSLHHIRPSRAGFDLILSNSNADKTPSPFGVCSCRAWLTCSAFG